MTVNQFGTRFLNDPSQVFSHNAWDHVDWTPDQLSSALAKVTTQLSSAPPMDDLRRSDLDENADKYWDTFYRTHENRFFKDRKWLASEFPELFPYFHAPIVSSHIDNDDNEDDGDKVIDGNNDTMKKVVKVLDVGCGTGATTIPVLLANQSHVHVTAVDFASSAIECLQNHPSYDSTLCRAFVFDIAADENVEWDIEEDSMDVAVLIFVLSAITPEKMDRAIKRIYRALRPGGKLLVRDYGRLDLTQLRFKPNRVIDENFYVRGDNTQVYFFATDDLKERMEKCGFQVLDCGEDKRLLVNRAKQLKMYRVWIQAKFMKPIVEESKPK